MSPHGTQTRYSYGCHCLACCDAHAEYMRAWRAGELSDDLPVDEARAHLHALHARRNSWRSIAVSSGLPLSVIRYVAGISAGYTPVRIRRTTHDAIMGCTGVPGRGTTYVDARPTHELIDRAVAAGHQRLSIAKAAGYRDAASLPKRTSRCIQASTARRIGDACAQLGVAQRTQMPATHRLVGVMQTAELLGMEIDAVAEAAGTTPVALDRAQTRVVSEDYAERVARALGVRVERIAEAVA